MICVDARNEIFEHIELFDSPAMFTNARVDRSTVPEGLFCYDVRGSDNDPGELCTIENHVLVNHAGTVIGAVDYRLENSDYKTIGDGINFLGDEITLDEFASCTASRSASRKRVCWTPSKRIAKRLQNSR